MGRPLNRVEGYEHGSHARAFLRWRGAAAGLRLGAPERDEATLGAMRAAGDASREKFRRHLPLWHDLCRPIPRSYADFIGVTEAGLLTAVQADWEAYRWALTQPVRLHTWTLRRLAGFYELRRFPADCRTEHDCLVHVVTVCLETGLRACINVPGLKTFRVVPSGALVTATYYEPSVKVSRAQIVFGEDGRNEGAMRPE